MLKSLFAIVALFAAPLLHAQLVEVYGTVSGVHANNVPGNGSACDHGYAPPPCPDGDQTIQDNGVSAGGGVTLNFLRVRLATLGVDVRFSRRIGADGVNLVSEVPSSVSTHACPGFGLTSKVPPATLAQAPRP